MVKAASFNFDRFFKQSTSEFFDLIFEALLKNLRGVRKQGRPAKDEHRADPQGPGERVGEVDDREDEGEELPEGQHQGDGEGGALSRQ